MQIYLYILLTLASLYILLNFKRDIHSFQQNSYRIPRYWRWLKHGNIMNAWRLTDVAVLFLLLTPFYNAAIFALPILFVCKIVFILRKKYKKPLVFTKRVWRLYSCAALISMLILALTVIYILSGKNLIGINAYHDSPWLLPFACVCLLSIFSWAVVVCADILMLPVEKYINKRYYNDAKRILMSAPGLKVIGITGSYGKTSTKHYLQRILSEKYETLMTPGSYNTTMGVIRTVREMLKPYHEIFICEMGAKQKGDVKEICDLVEPEMGIITAVGPMHLETFKSIEKVQATKFELADALPSDGLVVVNNDFELCANREVSNTRCLRYGVSNLKESDFVVKDIDYTASGTSFTIAGPDGFLITLFTKLIGESNLSNLTAAVIIALSLGVEDDMIKRAVAHIEQVEHRLSIKRTAGGVTIIDDAYNSNPVGSRMAVEALGKFDTGRRIIVTPGMIELGDRQKELNGELGQHIAKNVDLAIIVGEYNREALLAGIEKDDCLSSEQIVVVGSFNEAQQYLSSVLKPGDVLLYENDLPDTFK